MNDTLAMPSESRCTVAGKYLTFTLDRESFAIDVLKVREIIRTMSITAVPQMPSHVRGVINLRGKIIPVIDLRLRFGLPAGEGMEHTCIIVVQVKCSGRPVQMGIVVDDVEDVLNIHSSEIEETPNFGSGVEVESIIGMAKIKGAVKTLLDIDRILGGEETAQTQAL